MRNAVCENLQCHFYFYICRKIQIKAMGILFIKILRIFVVLAVLFSGTMGYVISEKTLAACWRSIGGRYVDSSSLSEVDMADDRREQDCECTVSFGMRGFFLLCIVSFRQQFVGGR